MNDLHFVKYKPHLMMLDTIGMSPLAQLAHRRLFDMTIIDDNPPANDDYVLSQKAGCTLKEWPKIKRELMAKGWRVSGGAVIGEVFVHKGTVETMNESKELYVAQYNRTAKANKKDTLYVTEKNPVTGCVKINVNIPSIQRDGERNIKRDVDVTQPVTDSVTKINYNYNYSKTPPLVPQGDGEKSDLESEPAEKPKGPLQLRAEALMHRRPETPLTAAEQRAFKKNRAAIQATTEEQWKSLEEFYAAPQHETYARKDLATLINNWNGEIDRATAWTRNPNAGQRQDKMKELERATRELQTLGRLSDYDDDQPQYQRILELTNHVEKLRAELGVVA